MSPTHRAQKAYTTWRETMLKGSDTDVVIPAWGNATPLTRKAWIAAMKAIEEVNHA